VARLRRARISATICFLIYGVVVATWASRLPFIKRELGLNTAQLSLALVGTPAGLIVSMQLIPVLVRHLTSAVVSRLAIVSASTSIVLLPLAWNLISLAIVLFLLGMSLGALDTAMNTQGVAIERGYRRPIMSMLHGMYSIGILIGGLLGALAAHGGVDPLIHFTIVGACLTGLGTVGLRSLLGEEADAAIAPRVNSGREPMMMKLSNHPSLIAVGLIAFCCLLAEGAVDDWSGIYLREVRHASFGSAPLGAVACGAGMAIGRFRGDAVIARHGRGSTLWRASVVASSGMVLAVLAPGLALSIIGYGVLGVGVATIVPIAFSLAGNMSGLPPAWSISRATTLGYAGLFTGPPMIGFLAHQTDLTVALTIPAVLLLLIGPLSRIARGG
jgi:fucose permease